MKKFQRFFGCLMAVVMIISAVVTPAFAAAQAKTAKVDVIKASWLQKSQMVDWGDAWSKDWVDYWLTQAGAKTEQEKARALYDVAVYYAGYDYDLLKSYVTYNGKNVQVQDVPNADLGYYVPQRTFMESLREVTAYIGGDGARPKWTCNDFSHFYVGLLRTAGIAAYVEVGSTSDGRMHSRVTVMLSNKNAYYCDPTYGVTSNNTNKYFWMTDSAYTDNGYVAMYVASEKLPAKTPGDRPGTNVPQQPPTVDPNGKPVVRPDYDATAKAVWIPAENRWSGTELVVPVTKNGKLQHVPMNAIYYGDHWFLTVRDICMVLEDTDWEVNISWSSDRNTVMFTVGSYTRNGSETNWTHGAAKTVNKTAQAYRQPNAWYGGEQTGITILTIDGVSYAYLPDISRMRDFAGTRSYEDQYGGSFFVE